MTCIVALKDNGAIWMGADSAGVGGYGLTQRADPKIYRVGHMLIGFTSSFRMGQLLGYKLKVPDHDPRMPVEKYMATEFIDACRTCLKEGGFAGKEKEVESAGTFLVAYKGRIFRICDDYQVGESIHTFEAVGCGFDLALGSLHATQTYSELSPDDRVRVALHAAETFSAGVRAPFLVQKLESAQEGGKT